MIDFDFIYNNIVNIKFLLVCKENNEYIAKKSYINKDLNNTFIQLYIKKLEDLFNSKELEKLDYEINEDETIAYLDEEELVSSNNSLYKFIKDKFINIDSIKRLEELNSFAKNALFYSFVFELNNKESFIIIRKMTSNYSLKNKSIFCLNDSRLNMINDDIIAFDNKIDIVIYKNKIYILNKYNFEILFSYRIYYKDRAEKVLNKLKDSNIIDNINDFETDCLDRSRIVKKLANIQDSDILDKFIDKFHNNPDIINNSINNYNLGIEIENNKIKYNDISSLLQIVNFISDNYFQSDITETKYTARSKRKLDPQ